MSQTESASTPPTYQSLLDEISTIASAYSLDVMLKGFTPELINILMNNHLDKIKLATDYESSQKLINDAVSAQLGVAVDASVFITKLDDRKRLYELFAFWRTRLLEEASIQV
jgi:hypothetical protein